MTTGRPVLEHALTRRSVRPRLTIAFLLAAVSASCGDLQRQGQSASYLLIGALQGAPGSDPSTFGGTLPSDVITVVDGTPTVFNDLGQIAVTVALKDPGTATSPTTPTTANSITIDRYHVQYIRTDGRNTQGVDVPYAFDGGMTLTVGASLVTGTFTIVRHIAKSEAPLKALAVNGVIISTIAKVTFYGHDQSGREVSAVAHISIDFANFGDKT
jgi:hypothetical protein